MQCRMKLENDRQCGNYVFKCKGCGAAGCRNGNCRNQTFNGTLCLKCGKTSATS